MRHRTFTDRDGLRWTVTEVTKGLPTFSGNRERRATPRSGIRDAGATRSLSTRELEVPWLCFESANERRRLSRIPARWDELPEDELEDLLGTSAPLVRS